jgi:hypothetical protein
MFEATESNALVTDPEAVEVITESHAPIANVLASAVFRGGKGLIDKTVASEATTRTVAGFDAARELLTEPTRSAVSAIEGVLDREQAGRVTRLIQAVWEGHGGTAAGFPATTALSGPLTAGDLQILFDTVDTTSRDFWRRIGRNVALDLVTSLDLPLGSTSLDRFVDTNQDRLSARAVRIVDEPSDLLDAGPFPRWQVRQQCLVLRGEYWSAFFAARSDQLPAPSAHPEIALVTLTEKVRDLDLRLTDVQVREEPQFVITIESLEEANVVDSPHFADLASTESATARSAAIAMRSGRNLVIDFLTGTASGHTSAAFALGELGPVALRLLLADDSQTDAALAKVAIDPDDLEEGHQLSIFDQE